MHMGIWRDFWYECRDSSRMQFNDIFQNMKYIPLNFVYSVYPREIYSFSSVKPWHVFACISKWYPDLAYYLFATPVAMTMLRQKCLEEGYGGGRVKYSSQRNGSPRRCSWCLVARQNKEKFRKNVKIKALKKVVASFPPTSRSECRKFCWRD